jgi:hypothetical protein
MASPNKAVGESLCDNPECGRPVVWRENAQGTLSYCCQWCALQSYAKFGTVANLAIRLALKPLQPATAADNDIEPAAPAVAPKPAAPAVEKPAPAARRSGLLIGG